ncbi:hypothetical protein [Levilactobacillus acidifarinae]|uniref:Uncharacterized protein n=1 Tax=Levilactobacillus acidifarinae DSM 19394 = JCM 15949 TaxID=1423715 RepID=A0A0R1LIK7_9LACO|nr:hypothetical protein [Levilactobacillus acidifarinae]KRK95631.1 hypothetical protein FD25_GL000046 [Levilactobacillus acidifarinae DSM 19394]GEO69366.1 hypothetical protein LAC03_12760 [Levilactobacillus acidifarinae]
MTAAQPDLNQFIQENHLYASLWVYRYSRPDIIRPDAGDTVTLLSREQRRLTVPVARYKLQQAGLTYADQVDLVDLQTAVDRLLTGETLPVIIDNVPDLSAVAELIRGANQRGLRVVGRNQAAAARWDVDDDETKLLKGLAAEGELNIMASSDGAFQEIVNQDDEVAATSNGEMRPNEHPFMRTTAYYEIIDETGTALLQQVPLRALGAVLFALAQGLSVATVKRLLLWPQLSRADLAGARLVLGRNFRSQPYLVASADELLQIRKCSILTDASESVSFLQYTGESGRMPLSLPVSLDDGRELLSQVAHGMTPDVDQQGRQLATTLSQLAEAAGVQIRRYDRQLTDICDIDYFKVAADGHQIEDLQADSQESMTRHPVETVFDVLDPATTRLIRYDLTFYQLVTYLVAQTTHRD